MIRLGVVGSSEGNGHPFSFSAIVNGYEPELMRAAGWGLIAEYLDERDPVELGISEAQVTHAWCPDGQELADLCAATRIPNATDSCEDMLGEVDAVLLARDDWQVHWELARPFLESGTPVFVDKPLSLDPADVAHFRPHLEAGLVMSCSGYRFAPELDRLIRQARDDADRPLVLQGIGPRDWSRYAVHLVDPLMRLTDERAVSVTALDSAHDAVSVGLSNGSVMTLHCLGRAAPGFVLNVTSGRSRHELVLNDRFSAFKRMIGHFLGMVETGRPAIDPHETLETIRILQLGAAAISERR